MFTSELQAGDQRAGAQGIGWQWQCQRLGRAKGGFFSLALLWVHPACPLTQSLVTYSVLATSISQTGEGRGAGTKALRAEVTRMVSLDGARLAAAWLQGLLGHWLVLCKCAFLWAPEGRQLPGGGGPPAGPEC